MLATGAVLLSEPAALEPDRVSVCGEGSFFCLANARSLCQLPLTALHFPIRPAWHLQHKGGTNPELTVRTGTFPVLDTRPLGTDGTDTPTSWGHMSQASLALVGVAKLRCASHLHT